MPSSILIKCLPPYIMKWLSLLMSVMIGSCRIYYVFWIKAARFRKRYSSCNRFARKKVLLSPIFFKTLLQTCKSNRALHLLTIDEVEKVQRQRIASFIGHVFQLTYAAMVNKLIQQEKLNHCHGCAIQHPSQNQHSCLMIDNDDTWMHYHDEVLEKSDLNSVLNATESICNALGFKLGKSWEAYVNELPKIPWTSIYLASRKLNDFQQGDDLQSRILYALYYGPSGFKWKDFRWSTRKNRMPWKSCEERWTTNGPWPGNWWHST